MPLPDLPVLIYRGHFEVEIGFDHSESKLSAKMGGGYSKKEVIFPMLRTAALSYPTLHRDAMIEVEEDVFKNRLEYIVDFYNEAQESDGYFLMKFPYDGKWYVWEFEEDRLDVRLIDLWMGAGGLKVRQAYIAGITPDNGDGSFDDD